MASGREWSFFRRFIQRTYTQVRVVNAPRAVTRDVYHLMMAVPWWAAVLVIVVIFLVLNALFALCYMVTHGIANARPDSFADAFFFSVQTMGTIGYGAMYPSSLVANLLMVAEAVVSLVVTAMATGLVFAKFSQSQARIFFSEQAVIAPMNSVPTLMFRVGNARNNQIVEANIRVVLMRTERTAEGMTFYRMYDLPLARERTPALYRSWTAMHSIVPGSLLHGQTPASLKQSEVELIVTVIGIDDTSLQPVHARHRYTDDQVVWGARHADVIHEEPSGEVVIDMQGFHTLIPTEPIADFPYPEPAEPAASAMEAPEATARVTEATGSS
ncbi:MAG TPA: ion channel [Polyangiaceae bacterium]|nr:ion channel [Polyangiaceae bacterium]